MVCGFVHLFVCGCGVYQRIIEFPAVRCCLDFCLLFCMYIRIYMCVVMVYQRIIHQFLVQLIWTYALCRFGYQTSTQVKLIAVLNEGEPIRETELKGVSKYSHHFVESCMPSIDRSHPSPPRFPLPNHHKNRLSRASTPSTSPTSTPPSPRSPAASAQTASTRAWSGR